MMRYGVNECCNCAVPGYPCLGSVCPSRHVVRWKCEECGDVDLNEDEMYDDGICNKCAEKLGYLGSLGTWEITGPGLPPFHMPADSFDEALAFARRISTRYNTGRIIKGRA